MSGATMTHEDLMFAAVELCRMMEDEVFQSWAYVDGLCELIAEVSPDAGTPFDDGLSMRAATVRDELVRGREWARAEWDM